VLRGLIQDAENIQIGEQSAKDKYLTWVETGERQLRDLFPDDAIADALLTSRHERIDRDYSYPPPRGLNIALRGEIHKQTRRLARLIEQVKRPGLIVILDCNVYMHCRMFTEIDWRQELGQDEVRIVLPVAVIRELDKIKYFERGSRQDRARKVVKALDRFLPTLETDGIAILRTKTTLEILIDEPGHQRLQDADNEIIERAVLLKQATGRPVVMVSDDRGMRVQAHARGYQSGQFPSTYCSPRSRQVRNLRRALYFTLSRLRSPVDRHDLNV
jgi:hypothetical protein